MTRSGPENDVKAAEQVDRQVGLLRHVLRLIGPPKFSELTDKDCKNALAFFTTAKVASLFVRDL